MDATLIRQRLMNRDSAGMMQQRLTQSVLRDLREWFVDGSEEGSERLLAEAPVFDTILQQWAEQVVRAEAGLDAHDDTPALVAEPRAPAVAAFILGLYWGLSFTETNDQAGPCDLEDALASLSVFALPDDTDDTTEEEGPFAAELIGPEDAIVVFEELGHYEPWAELLVRTAWSLAGRRGPRRLPFRIGRTPEGAVRFVFFAGLVAGGVRIPEYPDQETEPEAPAPSA